MTGNSTEMGKGLMEGIIEALSDQHSQVDLRFEGLTLSLGDSRLAVRLSGTVTLAMHMRELTDGEKSAHVAANIAKIQAT
jgi:hypothetical protein